jgi:epoxyqueuosine reductase
VTWQEPAILSTEAVRSAARAVGFTLVGLARAERLPAAPLTDWLQAGFAADMDWMHRRVDERLDPEQVLPGARTVVALAIAYRRAAGEWSRVAKYARGGDYHNTHRQRLKRLRKRLLALDGTLETYACVDTGVAMEKVWAERAGLGFIGKNGLLINLAHGSWLTLSVMFLDRAVDTYDSPGENLCGTCTRCLTSCPTEAFPRPGVVDSRRCIAYQSIENRDVVPLPLRRGFAGRVFGCDICADVCPFNSSRGPERAPGASREEVGLASVSEPPLRALAGMTPAQMAALTEAEFDRLAAGTALARAQYDGLRRNALLALGCARERSARALVVALSRHDPSAVVREAAAWALDQIEGGGGDGRGDEPALPS